MVILICIIGILLAVSVTYFIIKLDQLNKQMDKQFVVITSRIEDSRYAFGNCIDNLEATITTVESAVWDIQGKLEKMDAKAYSKITTLDEFEQTLKNDGYVRACDLDPVSIYRDHILKKQESDIEPDEKK